MKWIARSWWAYLFAATSRHADRYCSDWWIVDRLHRLWCRVRGHPAGIVFYSSTRLEPDTRCKECGDDIG